MKAFIIASLLVLSFAIQSKLRGPRDTILTQQNDDETCVGDFCNKVPNDVCEDELLDIFEHLKVTRNVDQQKTADGANQLSIVFTLHPNASAPVISDECLHGVQTSLQYILPDETVADITSEVPMTVTPGVGIDAIDVYTVIVNLADVDDVKKKETHDNGVVRKFIQFKINIHNNRDVIIRDIKIYVAVKIDLNSDVVPDDDTVDTRAIATYALHSNQDCDDLGDEDEDDCYETFDLKKLFRLYKDPDHTVAYQPDVDSVKVGTWIYGRIWLKDTSLDHYLYLEKLLVDFECCGRPTSEMTDLKGTHLFEIISYDNGSTSFRYRAYQPVERVRLLAGLTLVTCGDHQQLTLEGECAE